MNPGVEEVLREERAKRVAALIDATPEAARALYSGAWKEEHFAIAYGGLRDLPREEAEERAAAALREKLVGGQAPPGPILAAMLLLRTYELPLPADLHAVPDWLLLDYCRFLLMGPRLFQQPGESGRYAQFLGRAVALVHGYVTREPPMPRRAEVRGAFIEAANFLQLYFNELDLKEIYRHRAEIMEGWLLSLGAPLAHQFAPRPQARARIRVGVLCDRLCAHTETYFMLAHLERFPRERCELIFYVLSESGEAIERHAKSIADATVTLPSEDAAAVGRIRADDLDVLIVGSNVTIDASRGTVLACHRLARLQVISGSSPVTTGLTSADWYVSAELNETEEGARTQFTERVYRMPGMITRYAYHHDKDPATLSPSRDELGIPRDDVVFFSGANYFKITPDLSAQWARILAKEPRSWLVLIPFNRNWRGYLTEPFSARVLEQINAAGGDAGRVLILDPVPTRADLHRLMACADVYLDSFPFAGACSLLDPLLVGLPVVAHAGSTFRGSVGAGMLRGLGLSDMAAADADAYVSRAVTLARDPALRERERGRIRAALAPRNPIFDSETASRNLESAVVDMFTREEEESASLAGQPAHALRQAIASVADELGRSGNPWFKRLTDLELIRLLLVPYFQSLPASGSPRQLIDVGACIGQAAEPFLAIGWKAELLDPDPACREALEALAARHAGRARVHPVAVSGQDGVSLPFYRSPGTGLSGLSPSPFAATEAKLSVPAVRLDRFCAGLGLDRVDLLKVDAEGWDLEALGGHDFASRAPRLAMVEYDTEFARQSEETLSRARSDMRAQGYDAVFFSYEDHGNFKRNVWVYDLIAAGFDGMVPRRDGHAGGNIVFFRPDDTVFLATLLRLFLSFLPPRARDAYRSACLSSASAPTR